MQEFNFDVVLIGGGILSYTTAVSLLLKEPTIQIAIVTGQTREGMATTAAGAMLGCFGEVTKNLLQSDAGRVKHKMSIEAASIWPMWLNQINEATKRADPTHEEIHITPGTFVILNAKSGKLDDENFSAILQSLNEHQEPYNMVEPADIPGLHPIPDCRPLKAIYLPNEGVIDPQHLLSSFEKIILSNKNCIIFNEDVVSLETNSHLTQIKTNQGKVIQGNKYLIAAGAYSQNLINQASLGYLIPPIFAGLGVSLLVDQVTPPITNAIRTPNRAGACGLHALPKTESLYLGATNNLYLTPNNSPKLGHLTFLLQCAIEQINQDLFSSKLLSYSAGNRPATFDTFPLIGKTSIENLWILSGTYRDGFFLSPIFAEIIASDMLDQKPQTSINYSIFRPERIPIQTMTQEENIKDTVHQYMSGAYEHSMKLPRLGWDNLFEEMLLTKIKNIYQKLETDIVIPAEVILMLEEEKDISSLQKYVKNIARFANLEKKHQSVL